MMWVSLQMISLSSLLFLNDQISTTSAARCSRCIRMDEFNDAGGQFQRLNRNTLSVSKNSLPDRHTCEQAANNMQGELSNRALSPWRYSINQDNNRVPHKIAVAECLCEGCIINKHENLSYNSVPVFAPLMVLKRDPCPHRQDKYVLKVNVISIPVACTCVVPKKTQ